MSLNIIDKEKNIKTEVFKCIKSTVKEENSEHYGVYELNKKEYLKLKRKYKFKINNLFISCCLKKEDKKIFFKLPDINKGLDAFLRTYTNQTMYSMLFNASLDKEVFVKRYPFGGIESKNRYKVSYMERNKESHIPPYAEHNYIYVCREGKYKLILDNYSHIIDI